MIDCANSFADRDMFARFACIDVGHQIQYILPNTTEDENFVGDNDDELLAEGDLEPVVQAMLVGRYSTPMLAIARIKL